jgi:YVTN family beta-propeller protein
MSLVGGRPRGVAPSPDGAHVYIGNFQSNRVTVIDTATNAVTAAIPVYGIPEDVVVSPDGTRVYATSHGNGTVSVIDTAAWLVTATTPISFNATSFNSLAIGPDGRHLLVSTFWRLRVQ